MNDNLAHLENEQQPPPGEGQDYAQQQQTNNNASGATTVPPAAASSTGMASQYYPLPPPLDGDNTTNFHQEKTTTAQGWSSQEGLPPSAVVEQFGPTAAATATTTVVEYNNDAETHEFLDIPVGNNENDGVDINSLHPPPMMHLPEQHDELVQQPQQQHPNEGSSSPTRQPLLEGAMMPSLGDHHQQQMPSYDFNGNNDDPNSRKRAYHGFASSEGVPEAEQRQQELQHSPPPPNLPPVTLPPPPPNHQYPQDNRHSYHHYPPHQHHDQPEQQQLHHPLQNQEQAMNDPNYVHEQQPQPPPPPPIPHHSSYKSHPPPHYPPHQPQTQHPHYHPHQYYPSYHHQHQPPPSNHRLGYNTDRPTYLFSLPTTDSQSLSDRQCYIRSTFIELFLATAEDVSSRPAKGSQRIHLNQVGIRCAYCVDNNKDAKQKLLQELQHPRVERAVCFPQSISRIYQTVADMQRRHFEKCARIPVQVMGTYKSLKSTRPRGKGKPQGYWESSAREIGLVDSDMGIRVVKDGEGRMVERFLLQRKKVEEYGGGGVAAGGAVANDSTTDAAQVRAGDYDKKPSAAKRQKTSSGTQVLQSPKKQPQTNGGQRKTISVVVNKIVEPPPVSSYSDAHLLASMRDRASPPVVDTAGMINGPDNSHDVHPQLNEEEPMVQHGTAMVENNIHEMHRHQQQQQIPGTYNQDECILGEELTQDLSGGLNMNQDAERSDIDLQEDGANIGTVPSTENECDYKAVEGV
eukprot:scaffold4074_cov85-Skeletonema_dohrnii-CCMP3373.AAC.5